MANIKAFLLCVLLHLTKSEIYLPCEDGEFVQQEGCSCWNPQAPIIICKSLGLTSIPNVTKAHTLDLDGNNITSIPAGSFSSLVGMKELILSNNKIQTIHDDAFENIDASLEWLDLSGNELTAVPSVFNVNSDQGSWQSLTHLKLSDNYISSVQSGVLMRSQNLKDLHLHNNAIIQFSPDAWKGLTNLTELTLSPGGMDLRRIPTKNLQDLLSLGLFDGRPQKLDYLNPWFSSFPALQKLQLTRMGLHEEHLKRGRFPEAWKLQLKSLIMNDNYLKEVPYRLLSDFSNMEELDLSHNMIDDISKYIRLPSELKKLNLSNNYISRLSSQVLLRLKQAVSIDISNNKLLGLTWNTTQIDNAMQPDMVMYIGGNYWACICGYPWFKMLIHRQVTASNGHLTLYEINNTLRCGYKGDHDNELIKDVPLEVFLCPGVKRDRWFWKRIE